MSKIPSTYLIGGAVAVAVAVGLYLGVAKNGIPPQGLGRGLWRKIKKKKKAVRVYMDGCFDMMHYGHCNALRQARALGDQLVVGVVSDAEIIANKGPPVTPLHERMIMVKAVKWVDEVICDAPYAITEDFMKKLFDEYNIDYIIHGDDPCVLPDGTDAYALAKKAGRYKQIKRTEGVSSTDIVGRMLLCVRERSVSDNHNHSSLQRQFSHGQGQKFEDGGSGSGTRISHFLPTSRRIVQFSNGKGPGPDAHIVYIDGAFDLFHAGHVEITTFDISLVVHGTVAESNDFQKEEDNPYAVPISLGIFKVLESPLDITTTTIIRRIVANHEAYQKRNEKKAASERRYYEEKTYVSGD
ncbi:ethanolamine-phosphate cytidylyltransferase isoform X2 [Durio zibethinus]|uniref:ethanolamine-phosphate cytidylyltransferase n=1 Tax=Durio zibethinus TaxID=66656 RepID=A0A6P6A8Y7_DURZI|nr:ethanolamine-phosphate cytidylyltransferase isoform X2 [Durio zibethinus]